MNWKNMTPAECAFLDDIIEDETKGLTSVIDYLRVYHLRNSQELQDYFREFTEPIYHLYSLEDKKKIGRRAFGCGIFGGLIVIAFFITVRYSTWYIRTGFGILSWAVNWGILLTGFGIPYGIWRFLMKPLKK